MLILPRPVVNCSHLSPLFLSLTHSLTLSLSLSPDSPESAFVHALTSAITVHKITKACYENTLGNYCTRQDTQSMVGHRTVLTPFNISAGRRFAQRFLDDRPLLVQRNASSSLGDKIRAQVHIHNNGAGRHVSHAKYYSFKPSTCIFCV